MPSARDLYLDAIALGPNGVKVRKAALDRAHQIRQFEIDLYWKRANYFWLLQASAFAAVGLTWKDNSTLPSILPISLASLGFLTGFAGWLANKGSKFWQRNWEHQIDMLEKEFEGNLYKTVYVSRSGLGWSLTGVSESLSLCFVVFWLCTACGLSAHVNGWTGNPGDLSGSLTPLEAQTLFCGLLTAVGTYLLWSSASGMRGELVEYPARFTTGPQNLLKPKLWGKYPTRYLIKREPYLEADGDSKT